MQHIKHIQRIDSKPENRFSQPMLKDGLVLEDIMVVNETKRKNESKINEFKNLCKTQNIREIRKYIKRNDIINSLNTLTLNEDFPINEHRFVKRNGLLNLIHDANISTSSNEIVNGDIATQRALSFDQTDEQISLEAVNEKVNKLYDFCPQVQDFVIQQFSEFKRTLFFNSRFYEPLKLASR